jgi:hypothetical protein
MRPFDPSTPKEDDMYLCTDPGGNVYAVSPGGVKPVTGWELGNVYTGETVYDADQATLDRIAFYLAHGRWQLPDGSDPGPRDAKTTGGTTTPPPPYTGTLTISAATGTVKIHPS